MNRFKRTIASVLTGCLFLCLAPIPAAAADAVASPTGYGYTDVAGGWFESWVTAFGYPDVFADGTGCFHPDQPITRMEFARMLHRALSIQIYYFAPTDIGTYFNDVANTDTGAGDLYDLVTCGVIEPTGSFYPDETLTREETIHLIANAFAHFAGSDYAIPALARLPFADTDQIKPAYRADVDRCAVLGLIQGRGENRISPQDAATRAEAVTVAGRLAALLKGHQEKVAIQTYAQETDGALQLTLSILNNTQQTITISHTSGQLFDFVILDEQDGELYRWSQGRMFTMMVTTTEIAPGEELVFSDTLDTQTYDAIKDRIASVKAYITGISVDFSISPDGYLVNGIPT